MGFLYIIEGGGYHKIGITAVDVAGRIKQLQTAAPFLLRLVHSVELANPAALETALHLKYADRCSHGEWFTLTASDVDWLKSLASDSPAKLHGITMPNTASLFTIRRGRDEYNGLVVRVSPYVTATYY